MYITVAVAFLLIAVFAALGLFFKVSEIKVTGTVKYTPEEIISVSGIELDNSIFFVGTGSAEIAIKNAFPYVDSVRIVRRLPGTVEIELSESVAVAAVSSGGSRYLIDSDGRILEKISGEAEGIIDIRGVTPVSPTVGEALELGDGESVRLRCLKDTVVKLESAGMAGDVKWLDISNMAAITFLYNGYEINIRGTEELELKFSMLMDFMENHPKDGVGKIIFDDDGSRFSYNPTL